MTVTPALSSLLTKNEFLFGLLFLVPGYPYVVGKPATSDKSFIAIGNPQSLVSFFFLPH